MKKEIILDILKKKLEPLHNELKKTFKDYIAIIAEGSLATKDKWVEGRSDYDLVIIFERLNEQKYKKLRQILRKFKFNDKYFFLPLTRKQFLKPRNKVHDFSNRFKTKTLFGKDIIEQKTLPSRKQTYYLSKRALHKIIHKINHRLINVDFWSEKQIKSVFFKLLKNIFRCLETYYYYKTGKYPESRDVLPELYKNKRLKNVLHLYYNWEKANKQTIIKNMQNLKKIIYEIIK